MAAPPDRPPGPARGADPAARPRGRAHATRSGAWPSWSRPSTAEGPLTRHAAAGPARRRRRPHGGSGARPRPGRRQPPGPGGPRPDGRTATTPSCPSTRGWGARRDRRTTTTTSTGWPGATWSATGRPRPADLAAWAGVTLGDARRAFDGLGDELRRDRGRCGAGRPTPPRAIAPPRARLLGPVRPRAARMGVEGAVRRRARLGGDDQRDLPGVAAWWTAGWSGPGPFRRAAPSSTCSRRSTTPTGRRSPPTPGTSCGSSATPAVRRRSPATAGGPGR